MVIRRQSPPDREISSAQSLSGPPADECHRECHQPHEPERFRARGGANGPLLQAVGTSGIRGHPSLVSIETATRHAWFGDWLDVDRLRLEGERSNSMSGSRAYVERAVAVFRDEASDHLAGRRHDTSWWMPGAMGQATSHTTGQPMV